MGGGAEGVPPSLRAHPFHWPSTSPSFPHLTFVPVGEGGGGEGDKVNSLRPGGGGPLEGLGPENHIKLTTYSTDYRIQNKEYSCSKLMFIKLPKYLFYKALGLNDFDGANPLIRPLEGVGPENFDFFGPKWICPHQNQHLPSHINNMYIKWLNRGGILLWGRIGCA
jgi:hypothetical protein